MRWPEAPVEENDRFRPPFCPWPACSQHQLADPAAFRFACKGSYATLKRSSVPRFKCLTCGRGFSRQTFATSYYLKRFELLRPVAAGLVAGSAHRQIARSLRCAPSTVTRLSARLGRHGLLLLARCLRVLGGRLDEPIVIDHFETFEFTQDYPFGVGTAVGASSWFVYTLDPAPHRRSGKRSAHQQRRLEKRPKRPLRGGYTASSRRLMDTLAELPTEGEPLRLIGDGHASYSRAAAHERRCPIHLSSFPNVKRGPKGSPRCRAARARDRAMFPVDVLHALLRHSMAHHRRETIAFGRRINALMERFFVAAGWRNFIKGRSERKPDPTTPAMALGLADEPWRWKRLLARRLFYHHENLPPIWKELYRRLWETPLLKSNAHHKLIRAF
jgi:hypothetical protein